MTQITLKIGPAIIRLLANQRPVDWPQDFYTAFEYPGPAIPDLTLQLSNDSPPPRGKAISVAELEKNWRVYEHPAGLRLEILEQKTFQPKQIVLIDSSWNRADLYLIPLPYSIPGRVATGWYVGDIMEPFIQWWMTRWLTFQRQGLILHGSAALFEQSGIAFVGPSSAGKTTLVRLCRDFGEATVLNDERIVIWKQQGRWQVSGSPWHGELRQVSPRQGSLERLCFLSKAAINQFIPLKPVKALTHLMPEAFLPLGDPQAMNQLLGTATQLAGDVPTGEFQFVKEASAVAYLQTLLRPALSEIA